MNFGHIWEQEGKHPITIICSLSPKRCTGPGFSSLRWLNSLNSCDSPTFWKIWRVCHLPFSCNIHANQDTKDNISCPPTPPPRSASDASFPNVQKEQLHQQGEIKCRRQENKKRQKWSVSSFGDIICLSLFSPFQTLCSYEKRGRDAFRGGHRGCPNINYTFVHLRLTPMTLADPQMKTLIRFFS